MPVLMALLPQSSTWLAGSARILALFGRLHAMGGAELYADNTAEMWASLAPWSRVASGAPPEVLYSSLGFWTVTEAAWYRSPGPGKPA